MRLLRRRRTAFVATCVALVMIYLTWWITYAETHQKPRYVQLSAGQPAEFSDGTMRVLTLAVADELVQPQGGGDPAVADPGTVWVVVTMEVVKSRVTDRIWCSIDLLATDGRIWERNGPDFERSLPGCDEDQMVLDRPFRFEAIFRVPRREATALAGVAIDDTASVARAPVIRPPA